MSENVTQGPRASVATGGVGLALSVAVYFLTKNAILRVGAIAGGAWSALHLYEAWDTAKNMKVVATTSVGPSEPSAHIDPVDMGPLYPPSMPMIDPPNSGNMPREADISNITPEDISALERAINDLGSPTGLPDPDLK